MMKLKRQVWKWENFPLALAFFVPVIILFAVFVIHGGYPFGDRCFLRSDMYHQYVPFMTEFLNKLQSGDSLAYSFHVGLGSDFVALYAYYLASPINWLLILCPKEFVIEAMFVFIVIKSGLSGFTFAYYLKKHYGKNNIILSMTSLFYALGGFSCAYNWNIMWLDVLWLAPLIILGMEQLIMQKKIVLYYISLSLSILSNYYLSIMVCIFLVLYFVILFFETEKTKRAKASFRFFGVSLLAGTTGAVLLIPEIKMLSYTVNGGEGFPQTMKWYFNLWDELAHFCTGVEVVALKDHWPNIYCGAAVFLFVALYAMNKKIARRKRAARLALAAFFLLSFANNYLDFVWHGFHFPNGMPARQSFLFIFLLLTMVYEALINMEGNTVWQAGIALCIEVLILSLCELFGNKEIVTVNSLFMTEFLAVLYALVYLTFKHQKRAFRTAAVIVACVLVVAETGVNLNLTGLITTERESYVRNRGNFEALTTRCREAEDEIFYRTDKYNRLTKNDACLDGYPSSTVFSSLMNIETASLLGDLGMEAGNNYYCYNGATPLSASMLSVRYLMTESSMEESPLRTMTDYENGMYLYRNNYTLPLGYMIPKETEESFRHVLDNPIENQNVLVRALGIEGELFVPVDAVMQEGATVINVKQAGCILGYYTDTDAESIYADYGGKKRSFYNANHIYLLDLGWCEAGSTVTLTTSTGEELLLTPYRMDMEVFRQVYDKLSSQTMKLEKFSSNRISGSVDVKEEGYLLISIPDEEGWRIEVDGGRAFSEGADKAFIELYLEKGVHSISLSYRTPGLIPGMCISVISVIVFAVIYIHSRKKIT